MELSPEAARDRLAALAADSARLARSYDLAIVPPRPPLDGSASDTNDAAQYFARGMAVFERDPTEAAAAFAWATRLEPSFAQGYYNRWLALQQRRRPSRLDDGTVRAGHPPSEEQARHIDSLAATAFALNPFVETVAGPEIRAPGDWLDDAKLGRRDYDRGRYASAIRLWGRFLLQNPAAIDARLWRAQAMYVLHHYDDAAQELTVALDEVRRAERDSAHYAPRVRKELLSYAIGLLQAQRGDLAGARVAYEEAIADNLGFYMAHARLAGLALLEHDTTTALVEYETATSIRGDDPALRFLYGYALLQARRLEDAERQLREAVRLAPDFAAPYAWLGRVLDVTGDTTRARAVYETFVAHASHGAPDLAWVRRRLVDGPSPTGPGEAPTAARPVTR